MNDVFDEDLMKELGLDEDEIKQVQSGKPSEPAPRKPKLVWLLCRMMQTYQLA